MKKFILIISTILIFQTAFSQSTNDYRLAMKYYQENEFDKASVLFEKLFKQSRSKIYFNYYINCLIELEDFKTAEKNVKKQIKRYPGTLVYQVQLAYVYRAQKLEDKEKEQFNSVFEKVTGERYPAIELANFFMRKRDYKYAEKVYLTARKKNKKEAFHYELANVYTADRNYSKMVGEYVELLIKDETQLTNIQNRMQYLITNDIDNNFSDILRKAVLKKLQVKPNETILNELLIWLFVQKKEFSAALTQEIAIDKRFDLAGQRILNLGDLALSNEDFAAAKKSYTYIINLGEKSYFYPRAKIRLLKVKYQLLVNDKNATKPQFQAIEQEYLNTLNDLGQTRRTIPLMIDLAHIQAFYLGKEEHAIELLDYASGVAGIKPDIAAQCFLEMADIYMMKGEVWEATLIYAKVQKDNEQNPMGHEAKFRKARLAFYIGDFKWAQAQLDALKAATSKLIANDAFQLSQLIKDNLANDTVTEALQIYARAGLLELRNKNDQALQTLDSIADKFPTNAIVDDAIMKKADIFHKLGEFEKEAVLLQKIVDDYYFEILTDDAIYRLAELNQFKFNNLEKAQEFYKMIITEFPASIYVSQSRKRFRELRGDDNI